MRVKRGVAARAKHKKTLKSAKGMQHNSTRSFRLAKQGVIRALQYAYRDRRNKNAICAAYGSPALTPLLARKVQHTAS